MSRWEQQKINKQAYKSISGCNNCYEGNKTAQWNSDSVCDCVCVCVHVCPCTLATLDDVAREAPLRR